MNFKITSSAKMLSILAVVTGAKLTFKVEGNQFVSNTKDPGTEGHKEWQNATLLAKYIRDYVNASKGTMEARIKNVTTLLRNLGHVTTFRTLNNTLRRSTDDGSLFPIGTYFYEGTSHPLKVAARTAAPTKAKAKVKATPAPKATPAKPAPKAKAAKATVKATTPAKAKATVAATKPAAKPKAVRKPKATPAPIAAPVADITPDVVATVEPVIAPEVVTTPEETTAQA